jgi:hypothetical protein
MANMIGYTKTMFTPSNACQPFAVDTLTFHRQHNRA